MFCRLVQASVKQFRYEEADTFIWKMLRRWTTPPGNYANVGYQQDRRDPCAGMV